MSRPRYRWWSYVKWCIRDYPAKCAELGILRQQLGASRLDGMPRARRGARSTEDAALRGFTGQRRREFDGVAEAIEDARRKPDGEDILVLIDLVFWRQTHTIEGAAHKARMSSRTAYRRYKEFVLDVGRHMGFLD